MLCQKNLNTNIPVSCAITVTSKLQPDFILLCQKNLNTNIPVSYAVTITGKFQPDFIMLCQKNLNAKIPVSYAITVTGKFQLDFVMLCQKTVFIIFATLIGPNITNIKLHLKFPDKHIYKLLLLTLVLCMLEGSLFCT